MRRLPFPIIRLCIAFLMSFTVFSASAQTVEQSASAPQEQAAPTQEAETSKAGTAETPPAEEKTAVADMTPAQQVEECALCHKELYDNMAASRHGAKGDSRTPWGKEEMCTSCHGSAGNHIEDPIEHKPEIVFNKEALAADKAERCLTCHQGGNRMHWAGGPHDRSEVACSDCHKVHAAKDQVLVQETQAGVCFTCHKNVRSEIMRVSSHPIKSGQLACTSCHQPHGTESDRLMIKDTINDTCYTCHAEKRGPFLWEHPPVRDSCVNCHSPHGTNNAPMLQARRPQLCQQCHIPTFHPAAVYDGVSLPPGRSGDKLLNFSCQNCHTKIHGSNHPSGGNLTR